MSCFTVFSMWCTTLRIHRVSLKQWPMFSSCRLTHNSLALSFSPFYPFSVHQTPSVFFFSSPYGPLEELNKSVLCQELKLNLKSLSDCETHVWTPIMLQQTESQTGHVVWVGMTGYALSLLSVIVTLAFSVSPCRPKKVELSFESVILSCDAAYSKQQFEKKMQTRHLEVIRGHTATSQGLKSTFHQYQLRPCGFCARQTQ